MTSNKADEYKEWVTATQEAFNAAAKKSTGAARPVFERLRDTHAVMQAVPQSRRIGTEFCRKAEDHGQAYSDAEMLAQTDKAAAKIWAEAREKIRQATVKFQESP